MTTQHVAIGVYDVLDDQPPELLDGTIYKANDIKRIRQDLKTINDYLQTKDGTYAAGVFPVAVTFLPGATPVTLSAQGKERHSL